MANEAKKIALKKTKNRGKTALFSKPLERIRRPDPKTSVRPENPPENQYRLLFDNHPHPMWLIDVETLFFLEVNDAAVEKYGYTRQEFLSMTAKDIRPPESVPELLRTWKKARERKFAAGEPKNVQQAGAWKHRKKDGTLFDVEIIYCNVRFNGKQAVLTLAQDLTERKRMEEALKKSNDRFQFVFRATNDALWDWDIVTDQVLWNEGVQTLFGYSKTEVGADAAWWIANIHPEDRERITSEIYKKLGQKEEFWSGEYRYHRADGTYTEVFDRGYILFDEDRRPVRMIGSMMDISHRKRAEDALRESEKRTHTLAEISPVGIYRADRKGRCIYANKEACRVTGLSLEEFLNQGWMRAVDPEDRPRIEQERFAAIQSEAPFRSEYRFLHADGTPAWVVGQEVTERNSDGQITGTVGTLTDITDRKRAEEEVNLLQSLILAMNESADIHAALGVVLEKVCRATGWVLGQAWIPVPEKRVLKCSPIWYCSADGMEKFRASSESQFFSPGIGLPGRVWASKHPTWVRDVTMDTNFPRGELARGAGLKAGMAFPVLSHDEVLAVIEFYVQQPRAEDERLVRLISAVTAQLGSVIERKKTEDALAAQAQELARSNADLEQFAYVASHDLSEPLRVVKIYLQLLQKKSTKVLEPDLEDYITQSVEAAARMQRLIDDLLAYARVGRHNKKAQPIEFATVLKHASENLKAVLEETRTTVTADPLPVLVAVETEMVQLLQNLISNSIKFRGAEPPRIHLGARRENWQWIFSLKDNGIGMEMKYAERIFMIFQRLHSRKEYPGTGIGLAIARKIVENHGGRIRVESAPGQGSTFYFSIPEKKEL